MPDLASFPSVPSLSHLTTLTTPSPTRAWQTIPHPTLPLLATCYSDKTVRIHHLRSLASSLPSQDDNNAIVNNAPPPLTSSTLDLRATLHSTISGGHKRSIRSVAWKPNLPKGELILATGSFDASVGLWRHISTSDLVPRPSPPPSPPPSASSPAYPDPDEDPPDHNEEQEEDEEWHYTIALEGHESEVKSVAFSAGGNLLATCSRDKSVWVWEEVGEEEWETVAVMGEHEGDVKTVAWHPQEELVASGSYDDEVRLWRDEGDDWGCVWRSGGAKVDDPASSAAAAAAAAAGDGTGVKKSGDGDDPTIGGNADAETQQQEQKQEEAGHSSTVWSLSWEPPNPSLTLRPPTPTTSSGSSHPSAATISSWHTRHQRSGPRLLTSSSDLSIRVWRRVPRLRQRQNQYSIIRARDTGETWVREAILPAAHLRCVYAVEWSKLTGRVVSCGGDGRIVVYEEEWAESQGGVDSNGVVGGNEEGNGARSGEAGKEEEEQIPPARTQWKVVALQEEAHGVFEVNHVAWLKRPKGRDQEDGKQVEEEELIVTTGDDGEVKVWALDVRKGGLVAAAAD